jgi:uncharacterized protein (DUF1697 family)
MGTVMRRERYVALLRGINIGGRNIIRMPDLKECFEDLGCAEVITYIQSGNVVFRSEVGDAVALRRKLERALSVRFAYASRVVLLSRARLAQVVDGAPDGFGGKPDRYRYDVIFLREGLTTAQAMRNVSARRGVDTVDEGRDVLYYSRLTSRAAQSHLARIASLPVYQDMTLRNWNTTTRLLSLMDTQ